MSVADYISTPEVSCYPKALTVNSVSREVHLDGELIELTRTEFDLLAIFVRNPRRVLTPEVLLASLWDADCVPSSHPLEVYVHRLRTKLGESGRNPRFIHNVRGVGYRFEPNPHQDTALTLHYDSSGFLRKISSSSDDVWGWPKESIIDTPFNPGVAEMRTNFRRIVQVLSVLEDAGVSRLTLKGLVRGRDTPPIAVTAHIRLGAEGDEPGNFVIDFFADALHVK